MIVRIPASLKKAQLSNEVKLVKLKVNKISPCLIFIVNTSFTHMKLFLLSFELCVLLLMQCTSKQ